MLPKPGKPPNDIKSNTTISLLPIISKIFEKIFIKRKSKLIPDHQFGFRAKHSTTDQVHRIVDTIERELEEKQICSAVFVDVAQTFDKLWHTGLILKSHKMLPIDCVQILTSYITDRLFRVKQDGEYSVLKEVRVPNGSVLGFTLFLLYYIPAKY